MAVPYNRFDDDIEVADDDLSSASEDNEGHISGHLQLRPGDAEGQGNFYQQDLDSSPREERVHELLQAKWPEKIAIAHVVWGVISLVMGK